MTKIIIDRQAMWCHLQVMDSTIALLLARWVRISAWEKVTSDFVPDYVFHCFSLFNFLHHLRLAGHKHNMEERDNGRTLSVRHFCWSTCLEGNVNIPGSKCLVYTLHIWQCSMGE